MKGKMGKGGNTLKIWPIYTKDYPDIPFMLSSLVVHIIIVIYNN